MQYSEHYAGFAATGLALILAAALASQTFLRRLP